MAQNDRLSHVDQSGKASMVDISGKPRQRRRARAACEVRLQARTLDLIRENAIVKGDVLATARIAGIMAAKQTSSLIPLCHGIAVDRVAVDFRLLSDRIEIETEAVCVDKTGIEMEALTAASVAALTIWDMCKAVDTELRVDKLRLLEKTKEDIDARLC